MKYNETAQHNINELEEVKESDVPKDLIRKVYEFQKPNLNLLEKDMVNLGYLEMTQQAWVSIDMIEHDKKEYIECLIEIKDIFAWSNANFTGLSTSIVAYRLSTNQVFPDV